MERTAAAASRTSAPPARRASFEAGDGEEAIRGFESRARLEVSASGVADSLASMDSLRKGREYAVAWELEVWKQAQEAKWTASMRARESERMAALEGEWRRREAQREAEHRRAKESCAATEKRLAGVLRLGHALRHLAPLSLAAHGQTPPRGAQTALALLHRRERAHVREPPS